jgi:hypothetical protein
VLATARAELIDLQTIGVVPPVLLRSVISLFALSARQRDGTANIFLSHC